MSKSKVFLAIVALTITSLACNTLLPAAEPTATMVAIVEPTFPAEESDLPATEAEVPRVSLEQAFTAYSSGAAVFVDVRAPQSYEISHIPGAINISLGEFETNITNIDLDKDAWIITYCT
jgi:3-mercaptopyruvate sulfurtransferase SseA